MPARQRQTVFARADAGRGLDPEETVAPDLADLHAAKIHAGAETVSDRRLAQVRGDVAHRRVFGAQRRQAVERQVAQERQAGGFQLLEVAAVGRQVVGVDVGQHRHLRLQVQE